MRRTAVILGSLSLLLAVPFAPLAGNVLAQTYKASPPSKSSAPQSQDAPSKQPVQQQAIPKGALSGPAEVQRSGDPRQDSNSLTRYYRSIGVWLAFLVCAAVVYVVSARRERRYERVAAAKGARESTSRIPN